ncbi:MAG: hypothetical protein ABI361_11535 [Nitrososphaera sp.]|jgi:hypothetical protein
MVPRNILTAFGLASAAVFVTILMLSAGNARAASNVLAGSSSCAALGGNWSSTHSVCTVNTLTVNGGDSLTVAKGVTLNVIGKYNSSVWGNFINNGTVINSSPYGGISFYNGMTNNPGSTLRDMNGSIFFYGHSSNYGAIRIHAVNILIQGTVVNSGTIYTDKNGRVDTDGGNLTNTPSGVIINRGSINSFASDYGGLFNAGTIINYNSIDATYAFVNSGQIINKPGGTVDNYGTLDNPGVIKNSAALVNHVASTVNNSGSIIDSCSGTFTNYGALTGNQVVSRCHSNAASDMPDPSATV